MVRIEPFHQFQVSFKPHSFNTPQSLFLLERCKIDSVGLIFNHLSVSPISFITHHILFLQQILLSLTMRINLKKRRFSSIKCEPSINKIKAFLTFVWFQGNSFLYY